MKQKISGYLFDNLESLYNPRSEEGKAVKILSKWLSHFQVSSKTKLEKGSSNFNPFFSVLLNYIQRGEPTRLNQYALSEIVSNSSLLEIDQENLVAIDARFKHKTEEIAQTVFRSLHIIDPRLKRSDIENNF